MKNDKRVRKTKEAIHLAFIELMEEVGFSKITVRMISERAQINRSTFYSHYLDKYDLLDKIEESILDGFKLMTEDAPIDYIIQGSQNYESLFLYVTRVTEYLYDNGKIFTLMMGEKGDPNFIHKISKFASKIWKENDIYSQLSVPFEYTKAALIGCITYLISEWVENDFDKPKEEFSEILLTFISSILSTIVSEGD